MIVFFPHYDNVRYLHFDLATILLSEVDTFGTSPDQSLTQIAMAEVSLSYLHVNLLIKLEWNNLWEYFSEKSSMNLFILGGRCALVPKSGQ